MPICRRANGKACQRGRACSREPIWPCAHLPCRPLRALNLHQHGLGLLEWRVADAASGAGAEARERDHQLSQPSQAPAQMKRAGR